MANGLDRIIVRLVRTLIDSYMEGFETAFPAVVKKVNDDGTVDVTPSIRNVLKNMQIEPDGKDGKPLPVEGVPVMWPGTSAAVVKFELAEGDPLLCVASSRDLRAWAEGGEDKGPYDPKSFSGNDLNDLVAIPLSRGSGERKVTVNIGHDGKVSLTADSVSLTADKVSVDGDLSVKGKISATGNVTSEGKMNANDFATPTLSLMNHTHATAGSIGTPSQPVPFPYVPPTENAD